MITAPFDFKDAVISHLAAAIASRLPNRPIWAVPMLEKERNKRKYELSEEEVNTINSTFGESPTGGFLESTLGDLFEAEVSDEDAEFEEFDPEDTDEFE